MNQMSLLRICVLICLILAGCDSSTMDRSIDETEPIVFNHELSIFPNTTLQNDLVVTGASEWGSLNGIALKKSGRDRRHTLTAGFIWLAVNQNGPRAAVPYFSHFPLAQQEYADDSTGFFVLTQDSLASTISNWPSDLGAPSQLDGSPLLMGDQMAWSVFRMAESNQSPVENLMLGMTVFIYNSGPESHYVFHRYDIQNKGDAPLVDLHIGYGADVDLSYQFDEANPECRPLSYYQNQTAFNRELQFNYFYFSQLPEDGDLPKYCYGLSQGFAVLPLSSPHSVGSNLLSSRIWRRGQTNTIYPEFAEGLLTTPESVMWALQGKSYLGDSMIDPTSGQPSLFAFTGDPVTQTGWLDERTDVRSMISFQPITLAPGEKTSFVVAYFWTESASMEQAIADLKSKNGYVRLNSQIWDY